MIRIISDTSTMYSEAEGQAVPKTKQFHNITCVAPSIIHYTIVPSVGQGVRLRLSRKRPGRIFLWG